jgi:hypothetical protein
MSKKYSIAEARHNLAALVHHVERISSDTNIVSEPLRPTPNESILKQLQLHQTEIAIAAVEEDSLTLTLPNNRAP